MAVGLDEPCDEPIGRAGERGGHVVGCHVAAQHQRVGRGVNREDRISNASGWRRVLPDVVARGWNRGVAFHRAIEGDVVSEADVDAVAIVEGLAPGALLQFSDDGVEERQRARQLRDGAP